MGGHLLVSSEPGVGSYFGISLAAPSVDQSTTAARASGMPSLESPIQSSDIPDTRAIRAGTTRQRHVLYVEDNPVNTMLMESIFERLPASRLSSAETGADAETRTLADPPDLLLLDMQLPDTDGIALLARLRGFPGMREVPAVAVSADALPEGIEAERSAGFCDYWVKPLDLDRTLGQLMKLLSD
jgi:CheY-like chemotaxis protein